ncbi:hypothetical protein B0H63DRAFT_542423 [Podospora didyma]|uniref:Protein kinase domain-containing protein n=1 Tax=Podospora didyma TaxID=330526 RepID=A0AAE0U1Z9_9PEZI|nr:hypothetical protein B0H63DRAFT_542423 [Podospora didyma]
MSSSSSSSSYASVSDSSTLMFDHEPFDTFRRRELQPHHWPDPKNGAQYILRVPRFDDAQVDRDVAALLFLDSQTMISHSQDLKVHLHPAKPYTDAPPSESTHDMLQALFLARKAKLRIRLWDNICKMTAELAARGWLDDQHCSIAHLDLEPRNILVVSQRQRRGQCYFCPGIHLLRSSNVALG